MSLLKLFNQWEDPMLWYECKFREKSKLLREMLILLKFRNSDPNFSEKCLCCWKGAVVSSWWADSVHLYIGSPVFQVLWIIRTVLSCDILHSIGLNCIVLQISGALRWMRSCIPHCSRGEPQETTFSAYTSKYKYKYRHNQNIFPRISLCKINRKSQDS